MTTRHFRSHHIYQHPDCAMCLDLCTRAGERLKATGFEFVCVSGKSEATYFKIAGRHGVLRIAAHRKSSHETIGLTPIVASLTFRGGHGHRDAMLMTDDRFNQMMVMAIGQYWLKSAEPIPMRYAGKRGTWEDKDAAENRREGTPA